MLNIEGLDFCGLVDTGAAVTAVSADASEFKCFLLRAIVTSVNGCPMNTLGKTLMRFVIEDEVFPFEAYVIEHLVHEVIIGRDFLQKFCSKIDFAKGVVEFSQEEDPFLLLILALVIPVVMIVVAVLFVLYMLIFHRNLKFM